MKQKQTRAQINELAVKIERNAYRRALIECGTFCIRKETTPDRLIAVLMVIKTAQLIRGAANRKVALHLLVSANAQMDRLNKQ